MKTVCGKNQCTGCMACVGVCAKKAIHIEDNLSAYNAVIDEEKCINCNACYRVCQVNHPIELTKPILWKQGWVKDQFARVKSSSGGVATAIEKAFVESGGCVCSCTFKDGEFVFLVVDSVEDIKKFTGSKYVKSNPKDAYVQMKEKLKLGKKILFVGLPCQVAGVKKYFGEKNLENLYTIDLICHGSPSPQIFEMFLKQNKINILGVEKADFRIKKNDFLEKHQVQVGNIGELDAYSMAFLNGICFTDNCYECAYARVERCSDITLGDSWGSELSDDDKQKGISLIFCQSEKGKEILKDADVDLYEVNYDNAVKWNQQLNSPFVKPKKRKYFFKQIEMDKSFSKIIKKCYLVSSLKQFIKGCLAKLGLYHRDNIEYKVIVSVKERK